MRASAVEGDDDEEEDDDDDDDFEEVPEKEGYEPHIPEHLREEYGQFDYTRTHARTHSVSVHARACTLTVQRQRATT